VRVGWIYVAQDKRWAFVTMVMNLLVP
jgi:hypothetical protein